VFGAIEQGAQQGQEVSQHFGLRQSDRCVKGNPLDEDACDGIRVSFIGLAKRASGVTCAA
jgi:hypothetical protein